MARPPRLNLRTAVVAGLVLAVLSAAAAAAAAIGYMNARAAPVTRTARIVLKDWPRGAAPVRILLLSDIHMGDAVMDEARLEAIARGANALRPDLVVIAGDFLVGRGARGSAARAAALTAPLHALRARLGVLAVLGNHDYWTDPSAVRLALARAGVEVLDNRAVRRGPLVLAGVGDAYSEHDRAGATLQAARDLKGPIVVLTHSPDLAPSLPSDVGLVLAGHTHCGQVVLPFIGAVARRVPLWAPKDLFAARYRCGLVRDPARTVIVTAGLGSGTAPVRFGAPPDVWLIKAGGDESPAPPPTPARRP